MSERRSGPRRQEAALLAGVFHDSITRLEGGETLKPATLEAFCGSMTGEC